MASVCRRNSSRTRAAGCCGRSGRTTGARRRGRRSWRSWRWRRPSRNSRRSLSGCRPRITRPRVRQSIERGLRDYLAVSQVIWLGKGVSNDETGGHVDNLACFVRPGEVCLTWTDRERDPQHAISLDAWERLKAARDARGRRLKVQRLPMPGPLSLGAREAAGVVAREGTRGRVAGERLAGSYVNFYIANGGIIMPLLDARTDRAAARRLKSLFPGRRVVGVPAREILLGGGNIHCITQQIPVSGRGRR